MQSFCYLGFDIKCSGTVKHTKNILNDKGNKALRPLLCAISRFNIPAKTALRLFHSYVSPILLYNTENWFILSDKDLQKFDKDFIFSETSTSNIDITHIIFLKYILGVSRSCPSLAIYGETGEVPISIKSYRLSLTFWHRVSNRSHTSLAKKPYIKISIYVQTGYGEGAGLFGSSDLTLFPVSYTHLTLPTNREV